MISGQVGDYSKQRGYVIDAYDSVLIEGFRRSMNTVAAFRFTNPGDSYSSRRGTPQHVGVIGVAVFKERARRNYIRKQKPSQNQSVVSVRSITGHLHLLLTAMCRRSHLKHQRQNVPVVCPINHVPQVQAHGRRAIIQMSIGRAT